MEEIINKRDSMIFYRSFYESIKELPSKNQLELYNAIFELSFNSNDTQLTGLSKTIFTLVRPQVEANLKRYLNGSKAKDKQNGSKPQAKNKRTRSKTEGNKNVNDNENVNVNNNENKKDNVNDFFQHVKKISSADIRLTDDRKKDINNILALGYDIQQLKDAYINFCNTPFIIQTKQQLKLSYFKRDIETFMFAKQMPNIQTTKEQLFDLTNKVYKGEL